MSAFVVDKVHIDVLVTAGLKVARSERGPLRWYWGNPMQRGMLDGATADAVGQMLLDENIRSVRCRYPDDAPDELPGRTDADYLRPYTFTRRGLDDRLSVAAMCKALDGYEYQACECDDWQESQAYAYCEALRKALGRLLPGYDDAPWTWDEQDVAKARGKAADAVREEPATYEAAPAHPPTYPEENRVCPVCGALADARTALGTCAIIESLDEGGRVTAYDIEDVEEGPEPEVHLTCSSGHIWLERSREVIQGQQPLLEVREEPAAYVFIGVEGGIADYSAFGPVKVGLIDWDVKEIDDEGFRNWAAEARAVAADIPDDDLRTTILGSIEHEEATRSLVREVAPTYGTKQARLKAADMERLAHAAGLELEAFAYGIRGIPERGWALVWRDSERKGWRLLFPNLWAVEAYLVAERRGAPGPVRLQDLARDYGREEVTV